MFVNGILLLGVNICFSIAISLTSPLFVNVGNLLVIPLSFIVDMFVHNYHITFLSAIGAVCIIIGFLFLEIIDFKTIKNKCCAVPQN